MEKKARTYRLSEDILQELQEIASKLSISETEAISRAIHSYYLAMKGEERGTVTGSIISFSEYQKIQDRLSQALYRVGELEGVSKEREERLKEKDEIIKELKERLNEALNKGVSNGKRWWQFW